MYPKIFITGGACYVGSMLATSLAKKGYHVTVLDLFMYEKELFNNIDQIKSVKGDIEI